MASMKALRDRMNSIRQTMKITNAMYLISTVKVRKARQQLQAVQPYFDKMQQVISDIVWHTPDIAHPYFDSRPEKEHRVRAFLVIAADKSLCGAYNHNLTKKMEEIVRPEEGDRLFVVGQMGRVYCQEKHIPYEQEYRWQVETPTLRGAGEIAQVLLDSFLTGQVDEVYVIYTLWHSSVEYEPCVMQLLPLDRSQLGQQEPEHVSRLCDSAGRPLQISYEPSPEVVLDYVIPNSMRGTIYGTLVESFSSEQSARVTAMDSATKSAGKMIQELSLQYNRARQAAITQEITEVVSGASAQRQ